MNPEKCAFAFESGILLGHVISKEGIVVDEKKVKVIRNLQATKNLKELSRFLGKIRWHARFLWYLENIVHPLYRLMKKGVEFVWLKFENTIFDKLKLMLWTTPVL